MGEMHRVLNEKRMIVWISWEIGFHFGVERQWSGVHVGVEPIWSVHSTPPPIWSFTGVEFVTLLAIDIIRSPNQGYY